MLPWTRRFSPIVTFFATPTPPETVNAPVVFVVESISEVNLTFALAETLAETVISVPEIVTLELIAVLSPVMLVLSDVNDMFEFEIKFPVLTVKFVESNVILALVTCVFAPVTKRFAVTLAFVPANVELEDTFKLAVSSISFESALMVNSPSVADDILNAESLKIIELSVVKIVLPATVTLAVKDALGLMVKSSAVIVTLDVMFVLVPVMFRLAPVSVVFDEISVFVPAIVEFDVICALVPAILVFAPFNVELDAITVFVPFNVVFDVICALVPAIVALAPSIVVFDVIIVLVPAMVVFDVMCVFTEFN